MKRSYGNDQSIRRALTWALIFCMVIALCPAVAPPAWAAVDVNGTAVYANGTPIVIQGNSSGETAIWEAGPTGSPAILWATYSSLDAPNVTIYGGCEDDPCGDTSVAMNGGEVKTIYGGGENSTAAVTGNTFVTIAGGTVNGAVYGGGKNAAVTGDANITITGGVLNGNIYGGGQNVGVTVGGQATVTVSPTYTGTTPLIIWGGGADNSAVPSGYGYVIGQVGKSVVSVSGGEWQDLYGVRYRWRSTAQAEANNNIVTVEDGVRVEGEIYGGLVYMDRDMMSSEASENKVTVKNGGTVGGLHTVYGGQAAHGNMTPLTATVYKNEVIIENGGKITNINGGYAFGASTGTADGNQVTVGGGTFEGKVLYGGRAESNTSGTARAVNNQVVVRDGTYADGCIIGGAAGGGSLSAVAETSGNSVTIEKGTFETEIYGGQAVGVTATASNNQLTIRGGAFNGGRITGGDASGGVTGGNSVTIEGGTTTFGVGMAGEYPLLYGGQGDPDADVPNKLNLKAQDLKAQTLDGFQEMNFYLPSGIAGGETMITSVTKGQTLEHVTKVTLNLADPDNPPALKSGDIITLYDGIRNDTENTYFTTQTSVPLDPYTFNVYVMTEKVADNTFTQRLVAEVTKAPSYGVSASPLEHFGSVTVPYEQPDPQTVTVTNTGDGGINITKPAATSFIIAAAWETITLAAGETAMFTVQPKPGLTEVQNYKEDITISGSNSVSAKVTAEFTVSKKEEEHTHTYVRKRDKDGHWMACDCGDEVNKEPHGGDWEDILAQAGHQRRCTVCGELYGAVEPHDWGAAGWVADKEPTATETGLRHRNCEICYRHETGTIPPIDGGCTHENLTPKYDGGGHWDGCDDCGEKFNEGPHSLTRRWGRNTHWDECDGCDWESGPEPHNKTPWETVKEPTAAEKGIRHRHCADCGWPGEDEDIPALGFVTPSIPPDPPGPPPPPNPMLILGWGGVEKPSAADKIHKIPATLNTKTGAVTGTYTTATVNALIADARAAAAPLSSAVYPTVTLDATGIPAAKSLALNASTLSAFAKAEVALQIKLPKATITLSPETLKTLSERATAEKTTVKIEAYTVPEKDLTKMQAAQVKGYGGAVTDINVYVGDEKVDVSMTIGLPCRLKRDKSPNAIRAWYLDSKGNLTGVTGAYNDKTGYIAFNVSHQSYYVAGYDPVALWVNKFDDVSENAWYYDAVAYISYYGYVSGDGKGRFMPEATLTRAMFATLVWNLEGKPRSAASGGFADVPFGTWYTDTVQWAADAGIVQGGGDGTFNPDGILTRQEMIALLYNYAVFKGYDIPENQTVENPPAADAWAETAVKELIEAGVLTGIDENLQSAANRAEVAQLFKSFLRFVLGK